MKECVEAVIKDVLPVKSKLFSTISLSRQTICHHIDDISAEIVVTLHDKIKQFKAHSLTFDESTNISDTSQLVVLIRGVSDSFQVTEEMFNLLSLKEQLEAKLFARQTKNRRVSFTSLCTLVNKTQNCLFL